MQVASTRLRNSPRKWYKFKSWLTCWCRNYPMFLTTSVYALSELFLASPRSSRCRHTTSGSLSYPTSSMTLLWTTFLGRATKWSLTYKLKWIESMRAKSIWMTKKTPAKGRASRNLLVRWALRKWALSFRQLLSTGLNSHLLQMVIFPPLLQRRRVSLLRLQRMATWWTLSTLIL
jgi:hypothetical protein